MTSSAEPRERAKGGRGKGRREGCTHHADVVEEAVLDERVGEAAAVAAPLFRVAVADLAEDPGEVDARAAAGEEEVVVELVLLGRRALQRRALDREHGGAVVGREEDVPAEAVRLVLPPEREALPQPGGKWSVSARRARTMHRDPTKPSGTRRGGDEVPPRRGRGEGEGREDVRCSTRGR